MEMIVKKRGLGFPLPQQGIIPLCKSLLFALSPAGNHPPSTPPPSPFPLFPSIPLLSLPFHFPPLQFVDQSRRPMRGAIIPFPNAFSPFIFFFFFQSIPILQAQCPRKTAASNSGPPDGQNGHQPGIRPPSQFIQTTFVHRDIDDFDREYSQFFAIKLAELRPRLAKEASLSLDNENVDCARGDAHFEYRCREYPLQRAFHFLVVEDSRTGAAVYSFPRERNWVENGRAETIGRLEMAILDALSRHSTHPLVQFASEQASAQLGFLRELSAAELEQQIRENEQKLMASQNPSKSSAAPILTRSPLEMRLLNGRILAKRRVDFSLEGAGLLEIEGPELAELIEADQLHAVFVLFWSRKSELSKHAFQIWAKTAQKWRNENRREDIVLGAVDCQREGELCRAFGIFHSQREHLHHWMAFRQGHRMGQQLEIGTPKFLVEWMQILLAGPLIRLESGQIAKAKEGILPGFEGVEALSLGQFRDEQQEEFRRFRRAAALLAGRYYFAYWLEPTKDEARLSTFRRAKGQGGNGMEERIYGGGNFDLRSLLNHITHSSMPEILDIGRGFTTDLAIRPVPSILLLHDSRENGDGELRRNFARIAKKFGANKGNMQLLAFLELDRANSLPLDEFEAQIGIKNAQNRPAICALNLREIRCGFGLEAERLEGDGFVEAIQKLIDSQNDEELWNWSGLETHFPHQIPLDLANRPHPFAQIQMEQIHDIFGRQQFQIDPLPMAELEKMMRHRENSADQHHPHNLANMDSSGSISGCPMMAHLNNLHDEL